MRSEKTSNIRDRILIQTDCKDCKWWDYCRGGCSGHAVDNDWRNKDQFCYIHKTLFEKISNILKASNVKICHKSKSEQRFKNRGDNHSDGDEHLDGNWRHLNSEW